MKMRFLLIPILASLGWMVFAGCISPGPPDEIEVTREIPVTVVVEKEIPGLESLIAEWKPVELPAPVTVVVEPVKVPVPQTVIVENEVIVEKEIPVTVIAEWKPVVTAMPVTVVVEPVKVPVPQTVIVEKEVVVEKEIPVTVVTEKVVEVQVPVLQTVIVEKEVVVEKEIPVTVVGEWHDYTLTEFIKIRESYRVADPGPIERVCEGYPEEELTDWQHLLLWEIRFYWWQIEFDADLRTTDLTNAEICARFGDE